MGLSGAIPALLTQDIRTGRAVAADDDGDDDDDAANSGRQFGRSGGAAKGIRTGTKVSKSKPTFFFFFFCLFSNIIFNVMVGREWIWTNLTTIKIVT